MSTSLPEPLALKDNERRLAERPESNLTTVPVTRDSKTLTEILPLALLASVSIFARQILHLDDESYRNFFEPPPYYRLALILDIAIVTLLALIAHWLVLKTKSTNLKRAFTRVFFLVIGSSLMGTIPVLEEHPTALMVAWGVLAGILLVTWIWPRDHFLSPFKRLCLIVSPAGPLVLLQLANWAEFSPPPRGSRIATPNHAPVVPIFVILFDEWSYQRTYFQGDGHAPNLPNFQAFADRAFDFRDARSQDQSTAYSVPHFLFQTRRKLDFRKRRFVLEGDVNLPVTAETPSLLKTARDHGYKTAVAGWHIPYAKLFGDQADVALTPTPWPAVGGFGGSMLRGFTENLRYSYDPVVRIARHVMLFHDARWRASDLEAKCMRLIDASTPHTFTFFHLPLPHDPFVYQADGSPVLLYDDYSTTGYVALMEYTDKVLGRLLDRIKRNRAFETALVIVMSDHSWRNEPDPRIAKGLQSLLKVPLLVKWPGQSRGRSFDFPVLTTKAGELIRLAMEGGTEEEAFEMIRGWSGRYTARGDSLGGTGFQPVQNH